MKVKFLVSKATTQTTCLRLMGKKMLVALMMEGKFSGEGIHSLERDDDMMNAMARELVERGRVGELADAVWADLKRERAQNIPSMPIVPQTGLEEEDNHLLPLLSQLPVTASLPSPQLVQSDPKRQQKSSALWPTGHADAEQMLLFAKSSTCQLASDVGGKPVYRQLAEEIDRSEQFNERIGLNATIESPLIVTAFEPMS